MVSELLVLGAEVGVESFDVLEIGEAGFEISDTSLSNGERVSDCVLDHCVSTAGERNPITRLSK